ncbi:suppressor of Mek1-like [Ceratina calcarata]|uniref:Suppressor of Mek1-like n=1 Tax=Ceratina calcarata TaxID=156304 RepID=A0AAJ7N8Y8_9HYME|nr:suppressor of Mek1-like [Ceratina calcarata]
MYTYFSIIMTKRIKSRICLLKETNNTNTDEVPVNDTMKLEPGNASPQRSYNVIVSGHSTPIQKEKFASNVEDSPELDYRYSPISMSCTQEGGNEVAWDWHTPVKKSSHDKLKLENNVIETPKRTKQLQKKRNSNSPLVRKPLKMKQVKIADREDIGKFTAELIALNEKIGSIQQNCDGDRNSGFDIRCELDSKLMIESDNESNDNIMANENIDVDHNKAEVKENIDSVHTINNNNVEKSTNYQDLFDDSIEDSMVKCSQEVEEKFNLQKKPDTMLLSTVSEKKESSVSKNGYRYSTFDSFTESSKSSGSRVSSSNTSSDLKTYSNSNTSTSRSKLFNITTNILETKQMLVAFESKSESADFPDDSFDECLATCTVKEESKSNSNLSVYDFYPSGSTRNHSDIRKQYSPSKSTKNQRLTSEVPPRESPTLENRKFFKTRSLSDQCSNQSKKNIDLATTVKTEKPSVSSKYPSPSDENPCKNDNFPAVNSTKNAKTSSTLQDDRLSGHCIVKYKSTSSLLNTKQVRDSNCIKCTPEEIERKRLEAKMRLEAKRKTQQMRVISNQSGATVKR